MDLHSALHDTVCARQHSCPVTMPMKRPAFSPLALSALVALYLLAAFNAGFWRTAVLLFGDRPVTLALFVIAIAALTVFLTLLGGFRWLHRAWLVFLILCGTGASFYADRLGVIIDQDMIQNLFNTQPAEAGHMLTPALAGFVVIWGVLPSALVVAVRVRRKRVLVDLLLWPLSAAVAAVIGLGALMMDYQSFSSTFRQHRELMSQFLPAAPMNDALRYLARVNAAAALPMVPLGLDATRGHILTAERPLLLVLVIGETARAQNWGLNGYARDTTPELRDREVINFTDVTSCGTSTAISVPCLFSVYGQNDYSYERRLSTENLLDVLSHAGLDVLWWENNAGHYGIADRVLFRQMTAADDAEACVMGECTDAVFLRPLTDLAATITRDTVVVLHSIGSHGPAYSLRYPPTREVFSPACGDVDFQHCTPDAIINAYDNTLAFTDHVLAQITDILGAHSQLSTAMLYVSDHGESLGENGLYLHGSPWFMAPEVQTRVPMVMWLSPALQTAFGVDQACRDRLTWAALSHDWIFHTVLGLADVATNVRDPALDLTALCAPRG